MERRVHEPAMECLACGYCLAGVPLGPCPECGEEMGEAALAMLDRRSELVRWEKARRGKFFLACLGVVSLYAVGAGVFAGELWVVPFAWHVLAIVLLWSVFAISGILRACPSRDRGPLFAVWMKWVWMLHLPWLIVAPYALFILMVVWSDRRFEMWGNLTYRVEGIWLIVWVVGTVVIAVEYWRRSRKSLRALSYCKGYPSIMFELVELSILFGCFMTGGLGLMLAESGARLVLGLDKGFD